jgi:hypothetical protein
VNSNGSEGCYRRPRIVREFVSEVGYVRGLCGLNWAKVGMGYGRKCR